MEPLETIRTHPRFNVCWPILYRGEDFIAEGTMVDISLEGGRFAGTMPVTVGMRLGIFIDPPQKGDDLIIEEAVVTWVSENEFGTQFTGLQTDDMHWLRGFLEITERRNSFRHFSGLSTDASDIAGAPLALPLKG